MPHSKWCQDASFFFLVFSAVPVPLHPGWGTLQESRWFWASSHESLSRDLLKLPLARRVDKPERAVLYYYGVNHIDALAAGIRVTVNKDPQLGNETASQHIISLKKQCRFQGFNIPHVLISEESRSACFFFSNFVWFQIKLIDDHYRYLHELNKLYFKAIINVIICDFNLS